jgi:hypothetical protein
MFWLQTPPLLPTGLLGRVGFSLLEDELLVASIEIDGEHFYRPRGEGYGFHGGIALRPEKPQFIPWIPWQAATATHSMRSVGQPLFNVVVDHGGDDSCRQTRCVADEAVQ